ncbi:MAG TPA: 2'-5' RNA ligase family protein [Candidatus Sulfotelmatobacter sp.]|nr:2'-5' RNA ligase family protein [Candidatus Sulfotelmatobacter sp.]
MEKRRYALVAYLRNAAGEFVENLRRELHPDLPHMPAHLTILPPRTLDGTESEALQVIDRICSREQPFEVLLGDVETFIPATCTVYIRIDSGGPQMTALHNRLNIEALAFREEWPYVPHVTIVKMTAPPPAQEARQLARRRWAEFRGNRRILLERLTFVREDSESSWTDLAPVSLGGSLVAR